MRIIIYVPGIHEDEKNGLINTLSSISNVDFILFSPWSSIEELEELNLNSLHEKLLALIKEKSAENQVFLAGRSFGGGIALTLNSDLIKGIILFAPAIKFSTVNEFKKDVLFKNIKGFFEKSVNKEFIDLLSVPILIFHDEADKKIPFSNSERMSESCNNIKLIRCQKGHNFENSKELNMYIMKWLDEI
ncbi:MAG: lysophospholipase [Nanoarchaeota archaeon]|nr:lysophospholipase [Nanoarchaeota archaeon]MBU1321535.1 lysophospholipase [Nanoarchaeota archaeon]MBU1597155.1 lysophospholipase [Nanoarchaeota archaeon]MBU2441160.1 lysophospholipase [Nanoarchaeota archaeon]